MYGTTLPPFRSGLCLCLGKGFLRLADGPVPCKCSAKAKARMARTKRFHGHRWRRDGHKAD